MHILLWSMTTTKDGPIWAGDVGTAAIPISCAPTDGGASAHHQHLSPSLLRPWLRTATHRCLRAGSAHAGPQAQRGRTSDLVSVHAVDNDVAVSWQGVGRLPKLACSASSMAGVMVFPSPPRLPKCNSCTLPDGGISGLELLAGGGFARRWWIAGNRANDNEDFRTRATGLIAFAVSADAPRTPARCAPPVGRAHS